MRRSQGERSEATQGELVRAARKLFGRQGFAETSIEQIVQDAEVTRGALYHHFEGKIELFRAVFTEIQAEILTQALVAVSTKQDPWEQIEAGMHDFLDHCVDPEIQQIMLQDGPTVLGWERWHYSDRRYAMDQVFKYMRMLEGIKHLSQPAMEMLANIFTAALMEAAKTIANAEDPKASREAAGRLMILILRALGQDTHKTPST